MPMELLLQQAAEEVMVDKLIHRVLLNKVALAVAEEKVTKVVTLLQKEMMADLQQPEAAEHPQQDPDQQVAQEELEHLTQIFQAQATQHMLVVAAEAATSETLTDQEELAAEEMAETDLADQEMLAKVTPVAAEAAAVLTAEAQAAEADLEE
tara:strand:- start:62 stop:517 length:456 start_codon:yes stop_codon:yes gene_type:complete